MKICILSNSHGASLREGWESLESSMPDIEVTFFAVPNRGMAFVKPNYDENILHAVKPSISEFLAFTSGGLEVIDVKNYDAFLVYGLFLTIPRLDQRYSSALKNITVSDSVKLSINYRLVENLCNMTDAPIFYAPSPLQSEMILENEQINSLNYHDFSSVCEWVDEHYAFPNSIQVRQAEETMGRDLTTLQKYSKGAIRLTKVPMQHSGLDVTHMNAEYGKQYLINFILEDLSKHSPSLSKAA